MAFETWNKILEAMDDIEAATDTATDISDTPIEDTPVNDKDILEELNKLFTPILVMQGYEAEIADKVNSEISEATVLTEKNMVKFDEPTRMSQLIAVCALLIHKQKNTPEWQTYKKAAAIKNKVKLDIQKQSYDEAKALAQKYLVMVSTTNNSSAARNAAQDLMPETQH